MPADYILGRTTSRYAVADPKEVSAVQARIKALDTSMDYLVGNSDYSCAIASEDEQDIILRYRQLFKNGKRIFLGMMENMEEKTA